MSRVYQTARGKNIDMDKIKLANEEVIAIGNMKVNARGDKVGANGIVESGRNKIMDQVYAVPTGGYSPNDPEQVARRRALAESNKAKELHELANGLIATASTTEPNVNLAVEDAPAERATRGSLAGAIAKKTTVKQEEIVDQRTPNGPTRI